MFLKHLMFGKSVTDKKTQTEETTGETNHCAPFVKVGASQNSQDREAEKLKHTIASLEKRVVRLNQELVKEREANKKRKDTKKITKNHDNDDPYKQYDLWLCKQFVVRPVKWVCGTFLATTALNIAVQYDISKKRLRQET